MSAFFVSTSNQRLFNTAAPISAVPLSMGLWVRPTTINFQKDIWQLSDTSGLTGWALLQLNSNVFDFQVSGTSDANAGTVVVNKWFYIVGRAPTTTNRFISVLSEDGIISTGSSAVTLTPTSVVSESLGANASNTISNAFDGNIAEFWLTNSDIQPDGAALQNSTLRQLARGGPFSIPHIAKDIVDYRSLRYALGSDQDAQPDYDLGNRGRQIWANINGVIRAAHPPLAVGYMGPTGQFQNRVV